MKSKKKIVKKVKSKKGKHINKRGGHTKGQNIKFLRVRISEKQFDEFRDIMSEVEARQGIIKKGELSLVKKILSHMKVKSEI